MKPGQTQCGKIAVPFMTEIYESDVWHKPTIYDILPLQITGIMHGSALFAYLIFPRTSGIATTGNPRCYRLRKFKLENGIRGGKAIQQEYIYFNT